MNSSKDLKIYGKQESWSEYKIVCLHALADQSRLLKKLEMRPSDCMLCDVYWDFKGHLLFISFYNSNTPGIDLHLKPDIEHPFSFVVRTSKGPLTKDIIEKGVKFLKEWIELNTLEAYQIVNSTVCVLKNDLF